MTAPCKTCGRDNEDATHTALEAFGHLNHEYVPGRPEIVVLCGSTRFKMVFESMNHYLTLAGKIVLGPGCFIRSAPAYADVTPGQKVALDELHKRKIDLADRVLVLNVGGYYGESTRGEIEYAQRVGKPVDYLEPIEDPA